MASYILTVHFISVQLRAIIVNNFVGYYVTLIVGFFSTIDMRCPLSTIVNDADAMRIVGQGVAKIYHHCQADNLGRDFKITESIFHPLTLEPAFQGLKQLSSDNTSGNYHPNGPTLGHALTFKMGHSMGADHYHCLATR